MAMASRTPIFAGGLQQGTNTKVIGNDNEKDKSEYVSRGTVRITLRQYCVFYTIVLNYVIYVKRPPKLFCDWFDLENIPSLKSQIGAKRI